MRKSAEELAAATNNANSPENKKDRFANIKKFHISHSTGDLNINNRRSSLSLFGDDVKINDSQFFEVMYVGKIRVSHRKLPKSFIDDAIPKFIAHDRMKVKNLETNATNENENNHSDAVEHTNASMTQQNESKIESCKDDDNSSLNEDVFLPSDRNSAPAPIATAPKVQFQRLNSIQIDPSKRLRSASIGSIEQNRTMVYILGRTDLRLISPDRKQILLYKSFTEVVNVVQGSINAEHFGIICNEMKDGKQEFIGYVFKCQSGSIASDVVNSMLKSLETLEKERQEAEEELKSPVLMSCEHCPIVWYSKLCATIDGLSDNKAFNVIMKSMQDLATDDYENLMEKYSASDKVDDYPFSEKNKFLMALVEAHCQLRQQRHVHDTIENRSEFLNQYLGGSTIFMKAKRSLSNSFDHLLKRRGSTKDTENVNANIYVHEEEPSSQLFPRKALSRSLSLSPNMPQTQSFKHDANEKPPINTTKMDMFLKVGNTSKEKEKKPGSWRQNIFKAISHGIDSEHVDDPMKFLPALPKKRQFVYVKRSEKQLRALWKSTGRQIILLIRMEKENARLQEKQNENEIRRMKLDYEEIVSCDPNLMGSWEKFILEASTRELDSRLFLPAIKCGVPRTIRGDVWLMLAKQYSRSHQQIDQSEFPNYDVPYAELLKNLTEHQHAIFLDIGRTFPNHEYYKSPFGLGQLSLFNILKAYSILDPDVGYCQGLAFICGVLLLHLNEEDTFGLLKHLMFERQLRLNYLPDMKHFQLQLYQMSRLIKDNLPELYECFERNEVAITLYASSWMLTIFSASFELGFVTRVFDLLFFASNEVIFRIILSLLDAHKKEILKLDSFEDIMEYMKTVIPKLDASILNKVLKNVYDLNITRQLMDYKIEYTVLKDELVNTAQHNESMKAAREDISNLQRQLEIAQSNVERLEGMRHTQELENQSTRQQMQSLEVTIETLGDFISVLSMNHPEIDIPTDVRRLLQQLEYQQLNKHTQLPRKRPVFKSTSVGHNLGMNLKVLIEQNENDNQTPPCAVTPTPLDVVSPRKRYFDKTFEQIKKGKVTSKFFTGDIPERPKLIEQPKIDETVFEEELKIAPPPDEFTTTTKLNDHPLSTCSDDDVHFQFNTIKLKSINMTNSFKKTLE